MKLIAQVKLLPDDSQAEALVLTIETVNNACNYVSEKAWGAQIFRKFHLHKLVYYQVRERFGLSAQIVVRLNAKVADAYTLDHKTKRTFKRLGAISYDDRILTWFLSKSEVSIWTLSGRLRIPFVCGERQRVLLQSHQGECDLVFLDGMFFLLATCNVEEPDPIDVKDVLGIDLGIVNIASDSDGNRYAGGRVNGLRHRHARLRRRLQRKGTKATRRLLKKRRRREARFAKQENHRISKELVARAKGTARGIALEELTGIRERVTVRKAQRRQHSSWSFADLRAKIEYKARLGGVPVFLVDPRNTSRTCSVCGSVDKRNRPDQSTFSCVSCGHSANADTNAAVNIRGRAVVNLPNVSTTPRVAESPA